MQKMRGMIAALACWVIVSFTALNAQEDEIVVHLQTESRSTPVYLSHVQAEKSDFDLAYLGQLEAVLRNDFALNGTSRLIEISQEREDLARKTLRQPAEQLPQWKRTGTSYLIVPAITQKEFSATLLAAATGAVKRVAGVPLTGKLAEDRKQLHRLADALHKEMTGVAGIASSHLLYTQRQQVPGQTKSSEIWECDYDGANARRVTALGEYCVTPSYIPSKPGVLAQHYLYVGYGSGQPRIFMASLKEGAAKRVTTAKGNQMMPVISRQRDKLAFICDLRGSADLFLQPLNTETGQLGTLQLLYHAKGATQSTPTFSPDGKEIAFTSDRDGSPRIYAMPIPASGADVKTAKPRLISRRAINGSAPAWSPDGQKIAFCALTRGERQIWVYDRSTEEETQITFGSGHKENPTWAPDSLHLVYNSVSSGDMELYLVDLIRMKPSKIALGKGDKHFPSWETVTNQGRSSGA